MSFGLTPPSPDRNSEATRTYANPTPAAVAIVPVHAMNPDTGRRELGLLTIERGIPPQVGQFALPGGYIEQGEDWRAALLRELYEETGVRIDNLDCVTLKGAHSVDENRKIVLFGLVPAVTEAHLGNFVPNLECPRFQIIFKACELAFSTHTEMARQFFNCMCAEHSPALHDLIVPHGFHYNEK